MSTRLHRSGSTHPPRRPGTAVPGTGAGTGPRHRRLWLGAAPPHPVPSRCLPPAKPIGLYLSVSRQPQHLRCRGFTRPGNSPNSLLWVPGRQSALLLRPVQGSRARFQKEWGNAPWSAGGSSATGRSRMMAATGSSTPCGAAG